MQKQHPRTLIAAAVAASAALLAAPAHAQNTFIDPATAGPYVGVGAGASRMKGEDLPSGPTDRSDTGAKAFVGYRFNPWFATELGYVNSGRFETSAGDLRGQGSYLDAIGRLPIADGFSAFGRVGVFYGRLKDGRSGTPLNDEGTNVKGGLGLQYDFTRNHAVTGEWERYRYDGSGTGKVNTDLYTVGYKYSF